MLPVFLSSEGDVWPARQEAPRTVQASFLRLQILENKVLNLELPKAAESSLEES